VRRGRPANPVEAFPERLALIARSSAQEATGTASASGAFRPATGPLAFLPRFCTIFFGTLTPGRGAHRFFGFLSIVVLGYGLGFLIAKSRFECRGRERERR